MLQRVTRRESIRPHHDSDATEEPSAQESRQGAGPGISLVPEPMEEAEVQAQLDDIDVDAPRVGIVMGSKSDMEAMEKAAHELEERGILHEIRAVSYTHLRAHE